MFGKILRIEENTLTIENKLKNINSNLMNCHVIFEENLRKVVGEIVKINEDEIEILLVGEIINNGFTPGVVKKPTSSPRVINVGELQLIIGNQTLQKGFVTLGKSAIYNQYNVNVNVNDIFANHFAIIGNTGSGKSCGVSKILQNLFSSVEKPINSHFIIFDAYGEYKQAFSKINDEKLKFKNITAHVENAEDELLKFPANFLDVDDLALLLSVNDSNQIPVLEKTLKLVYIFTSDDPNMKNYKNDIIAKCLLDILTSGKSASQMRDQIIAVLTHYNTDVLNLDSQINQPGYFRTLKQCLLIDEQGKMNAIQLVNEFLKSFNKVSLNDIIIDDKIVYSLNDIYYALEFALISEGTINSDVSYNKNNILKTRLQTIINSEYKSIFETDTFISKDDYVKRFFRNGSLENVQLVDIDLSFLDDRFAKVITKLLSKLFFRYVTHLQERGTYPINIILEEAHRYVQNDTDVDIIGYNIFDRICKEGRKYGCFLTFITQRPSELSQTALSQCSNFIVFRLFHPKDFEIVSNISTNVTKETLNKLKTLNTGSALVFGSGVKMPLLVIFDLPDPLPTSTSLKVNEIWY